MDKRIALLIFVCSFSTRLLFGWRAFVVPALALTNDSQGYRELAQELLVGHFPTVIRTPGYPLFLALTGGFPNHQLVSTLVVQMLLDSITAILIGGIALRLTGRRRAALFAGLLWAFCPVAAALAGSVMTETVFVFWVVFGTWLAVEKPSIRHAVLQLCCWCFVVLTRPSGLLIPVLASLGPLGHLTDRWQRIRVQAAVLACYAVFVGAWADADYERMGLAAISALARANEYIYQLPAVEMLDAHGAKDYVWLWVFYPRDAEKERAARAERIFVEFLPRGSAAENIYATVEDPESVKWMSGRAERQLSGRWAARVFVHLVGGLQIMRPMPPWAPGGLLATALDVGRLLVLPCAIAVLAIRERTKLFLWFPWVLYVLFLPGVNGVWRFRSAVEPVFTLFLAFAGARVLARFVPEQATLPTGNLRV